MFLTPFLAQTFHVSQSENDTNLLQDHSEQLSMSRSQQRPSKNEAGVFSDVMSAKEQADIYISLLLWVCSLLDYDPRKEVGFSY